MSLFLLIDLCPVHLPGQKIFCPGQNYSVLYKSDFVPDKKYFVWADGQGISKYLLRVKFLTGIAVSLSK